jgi:hypothetical protein
LNHPTGQIIQLGRHVLLPLLEIAREILDPGHQAIDGLEGESNLCALLFDPMVLRAAFLLSVLDLTLQMGRFLFQACQSSLELLHTAAARHEQKYGPQILC